MPKKLPKTLYVKIHTENNDSWFNADESLNSLVEMSEKIKIGVYKLVEIHEAEGVVSTKKISK